MYFHGVLHAKWEKVVRIACTNPYQTNLKLGVRGGGRGRGGGAWRLGMFLWLSEFEKFLTPSVATLFCPNYDALNCTHLTK